MNLLKEFLRELIEKLNWHSTLQQVLLSISMIIAWIVLGLIVGKILKTCIRKYLRPKEKNMVKRQKTVAALVIQIIKSIFWFYIIMMILSELGIDIAPILASAGILAFAVGFGAQELVKDLISGFFIVFENSFAIDDYVDIGGFTGKVIELGLRRTKIVNWKNEVRIISNGDIKTFTNLSMKESVGVVDIHLPQTFDLDLLSSVEFKSILKNIEASHKYMTKSIELLGVIEQSTFNLVIRFIFSTPSMMQHSVERDLRKAIIEFVKKKQA